MPTCHSDTISDMMQVQVFVLLFGCALAFPTDKFKEYAKKHPNTSQKPMYDPDLFEGDIVLIDGQPEQRNAMVNLARRWPTKTIPYEIVPGDYNQNEIGIITGAIDEMIEKTKVNGQKCIDIIPRTNEAGYVYIERGPGCSSPVGRTGSAQRLSLGNGCVWNGITQHEFLHAWGFYHEQNRNDRDDFVTINYDNIQEGTEHNFRKFEASEVDHVGTGYDYLSTMHYDAYAFAVDRDIPTIIPHDPDADISYKDYMSELDIERVQIFYCCLDASDSKYHKHLAGMANDYCTGLTPPDNLE